LLNYTGRRCVEERGGKREKERKKRAEDEEEKLVSVLGILTRRRKGPSAALRKEPD